ncbi:urease subunit gamma [Gordonia bronchialis]|uniref:urease subunit gamma n=1 Tax=Gordonia bronchialis TaxID=2054 RepID=UPI00242E02D3|nr:urease subunit gamma [Gordonia bronchialis]
MHLTPTEFERLTIFTAAEMARRNLANGVRLSHPEAVALITDEILLAARRDLTYDAIVDHAAHVLTTDQVMPGVAEMVGLLMVDAPFAEGTKLVSVTDPILPGELTGTAETIRPGEIIVGDGEIQLFDTDILELTVVNRGDRDIQVRSHAHFAETNPALDFDRHAAQGRTLAIASGAGVRFEPAVPKTVKLTPIHSRSTDERVAGMTR